MTRFAAALASPVLALAILAPPAALAQREPAYAQEIQPAARLYGQAELDQMLAPVALYPDALLSQLLMAATYPLEIVQAARWSRANPHLHGEEAVRAVQERDWDPSVKSMVAFPELLARMDERIEWTQRLGEAFLGQERQVMEAVQELRRRADAAGNLRSSDELVVRREAEYILLDPPSPEHVYVPYYDTRVVYGHWWWPGYEPVLWSPGSGYSYSPGYTAFGWGIGVPVGRGFFYGTFDWPRRYVRHAHSRPWYYHAQRWHQGERWRHDHRRAAYTRDRNPAWRGDGDRRDGRRDSDGRRDWRDGDRVRDHRDGDRVRDRDGRGTRDARREGEGRRDGEGQRAAPVVRSAPVAPSGQVYQPAAREMPARGMPVPPRSSIGQPQAAPAPQAPVPQPHIGRASGYVPQVAPKPLPAPVERAASVERPAPAPERAAPSREPAPAARGNPLARER